MERLLRDFKRLDDLSIVMFFSRNVPQGISKHAHHLTGFMRYVTKRDYDENTMRMASEKIMYMTKRHDDPSWMLSDEYLHDKLVDYAKDQKSDYTLGCKIGMTFLPKTRICCNTEMELKPQHTCTVYRYGKKSCLGTLYMSKCKGCETSYFLSYYKKGSNTYFYDITEEDYFSFTDQTVVETVLMRALDIDM